MGANYQQYPFVKGRHPRGWVETTVGEVVLEIRSGYSSGKHNQTGDGIPHLRPMNVSPVGEIIMEDLRYVSPTAGELRLAKNDVLFTNTSSTVWAGKSAFVYEVGDWGFSNHMIRIRVAEGMSPEFVARQLHYLCLSGYFAFHCKKHINQSSISGKQLTEDVPFRLPPANEQKRIAAKLRHLLKRERKLRHQLDEVPALIQQYRTAVLEAACTGRLVPTEAELARNEHRNFEPASLLLERILAERRTEWERQKLALIEAGKAMRKDKTWKKRYREPEPITAAPERLLPEGWHCARVAQCGVVQLGRQRSPEHHTGKNLRPYLRVANVFEDRIDLKDVKYMNFTEKEFEVFHLRQNDILLNEGQTLDLLGRPAMYRGEVEGACFQNTLVRFRPLPSLVPEYALAVFRHYLRAKRFREIGKIVTNLAHLGGGRFAALEFPLPPLAEQKRIVSELERRMTVINKIEDAVSDCDRQTSELRLSLFKRALSGALVNQLKTDEPANKLLDRIRIEREKCLQIPKEKKLYPRAKMKILTSDVVKETIAKLAKKRFSFDDLSNALQTDYEPLKDVIFQLLGEETPVLRQVFKYKAKTMQFERIDL